MPRRQDGATSRRPPPEPAVRTGEAGCTLRAPTMPVAAPGPPCRAASADHTARCTTRPARSPLGPAARAPSSVPVPRRCGTERGQPCRVLPSILPASSLRQGPPTPARPEPLSRRCCATAAAWLPPMVPAQANQGPRWPPVQRRPIRRPSTGKPKPSRSCSWSQACCEEASPARRPEPASACNSRPRWPPRRTSAGCWGCRSPPRMKGWLPTLQGRSKRCRHGKPTKPPSQKRRRSKQSPDRPVQWDFRTLAPTTTERRRPARSRREPGCARFVSPTARRTHASAASG